MQQMTTVVHDGNGHRPIVFYSFLLGSGGNGFYVGKFKYGF